MLKSKLLSVFVFLWSVFTLALLSWWVIFSLRQLKTLKNLNLQPGSEILKHQHMLLYEGLSLFFCLLVGAACFFYLISKENKRLRERKDFLSSFTHDLKTTISSLRLKLERFSGVQDLETSKEEALEIQKVGTRLNQQLQNALQISFGEESKSLYLEDLILEREVSYIKSLWSDMVIEVEEGVIVHTDALLFRNILSNLIQNAYDHAKSKNLKIYQKLSCIFFETQGGLEFQGNLEDFKKTLTHKPSVDSSGLGLKLTRKIMKDLRGDLKFSLSPEKSLIAILCFPKVTKKKVAL